MSNEGTVLVRTFKQTRKVRSKVGLIITPRNRKERRAKAKQQRVLRKSNTATKGGATCD